MMMLQNQSLSLLNYITAAIAEGLAERQAAKDEEADDASLTDENEKKAARLEAEAQAEGSRGAWQTSWWWSAKTSYTRRSRRVPGRQRRSPWWWQTVGRRYLVVDRRYLISSIVYCMTSISITIKLSLRRTLVRSVLY